MPKTLKEHRIDRMLTYRDLAEASGVAVTTIMALERGTRRAGGVCKNRTVLGSG